MASATTTYCVATGQTIPRKNFHFSGRADLRRRGRSDFPAGFRELTQVVLARHVVDVAREAATIPALKKEQVMSRHASLKVSALTTANRSVLKRQERINQLSVERRWKDGDDVTGLPKTKVHGKVKAKKA